MNWRMTPKFLSFATTFAVVLILILGLDGGVDSKVIATKRPSTKATTLLTTTPSLPSTTPKSKQKPKIKKSASISKSTSLSNSTLQEDASTRVKRGYRGQGRTGLFAYNRIEDSGQQRSVGERGHGHNGKRKSPVGEDGTHLNDFKNGVGVGYEHRHGGHCEESKCGYNIRHCPHHCIFNSFLCSEHSGSSYDSCCC